MSAGRILSYSLITNGARNMIKKIEVSKIGKPKGTQTIEEPKAIDASSWKSQFSCEHIEECKASKQVLFYLDECDNCEVSTKFQKHQAD